MYIDFWEVSFIRDSHLFKFWSIWKDVNPFSFLVHKVPRSVLRMPRHLKLELRPSIGSLKIWLRKNCSDKKKIENILLEIGRIEFQCSKCSLQNKNQNMIRKHRKYLHFLRGFISLFKIHTKVSKYLKYLPELGVDS